MHDVDRPLTPSRQYTRARDAEHCARQVASTFRTKLWTLNIHEPTHTTNLGMSGLADYLAKNYLTADSDKKSKKRKRKNKDAGLIIDDDDSLGWKEKVDEDDDDAPMIGTTASIRLHSHEFLTNIHFASWRRYTEKVKEEIERNQCCYMDICRRRRTFARRTTCCRRCCRRCHHCRHRCRPPKGR